MLGDIPTGGDSQSFGKRLLKFEPFVSGVWRPPNWTPEWKFLNLALCTTKCAFFTEIGDLIPWTTAPSRNEMQQFAPARCLGPPTSHYGGHGRCWCCLRHASWGFGSCGAVVIRARHESLGFSSRVGWTGCDTFSETYHFRTYIHAYTCHIDICIYVYTPDTCMHIWSYLYTHTYSHRAKHILSVLLRHLTPWSFLVFDGFQWLIASIFLPRMFESCWWLVLCTTLHVHRVSWHGLFPLKPQMWGRPRRRFFKSWYPQSGCFLFTVDSNPWIRNTTGRREDVFLLPSSTQVVQMARCRCLSWRFWDLRLIP